MNTFNSYKLCTAPHDVLLITDMNDKVILATWPDKPWHFLNLKSTWRHHSVNLRQVLSLNEVLKLTGFTKTEFFIEIL